MTALRPLRADAERNRQRIVDAAKTLFAERGVEVSVEDIAAAAGVGIGTFYRRFPDRESLIEAVFAAKLERAAENAREALEIEDPWEAFRTFVMSVARMHARGQVARQLVGIRMEGDALPVAGAQVFDASDNIVGAVTSSTISPILSNAAICLGYLKKPFFEEGTVVQVPAEGSMRKATVVKTPFV